MEQDTEKIMILCKERNCIFRILFENQHLSSRDINCLSLRSRYNPELVYYKVNCNDMIRYGMTADDILDIIQERFNANNAIELNEAFTFIERL